MNTSFNMILHIPENLIQLFVSYYLVILKHCLISSALTFEGSDYICEIKTRNDEKLNPFKPVGIYASHRFWDAYVPQFPSAKQHWDVMIPGDLQRTTSLGCICPRTVLGHITSFVTQDKEVGVEGSMLLNITKQCCEENLK